MNKKNLSLLLFSLSLLWGISASQEQQYLETKRQQFEVQTRELNEARHALEAYKTSFEVLQKQRIEELVKKEAEINATLDKIEQVKKANEEILQKTQENLKSIDEKTTGRVKEIYAQMKDSAIADVLSQMDASEASKIILSLEARKISGVLSKMEPNKASELTLLIKNLDQNNTQTQSQDTNSSQ